MGEDAENQLHLGLLMPWVSSGQGGKEDVQDCLAKSAGCINLFFLFQHIFQLEQAAYKEEELPWETITFNNNEPILVSERTDRRELLHQAKRGVLLLLSWEGEAPGKNLFKGWCRCKWMPCIALDMCNVSPFPAESVSGQASWASVSSG